MLLPPSDRALYFKLHHKLLCYVNQRHKVLPGNFATPAQFSNEPPAVLARVRDVLIANLELIDSFVAENPAGLSPDELDIVRSWRQPVAGKFYVFRTLQKYTVFLTPTDPAVAYGVLALSQPFEDLLGPVLPVMVQTVLLPFKDQIIYDGLITKFNIVFGAGIRRSLNESFKGAKARQGIVTALPMSDAPPPARKPKAKATPKPPSKSDKDEAVAVIIGLIDQFCREHLNAEYAAVCRKLAEKLARKRPSPLLKGNPNAWASGIVRAVGSANFLHDETQTPYMRSTDIDRHLGTSPSSGAVKLAAIRKMFRIGQFDPEWTLPSRLDDNPLFWMLEVNGFLMDVRHAPRDVQEFAFKKGLIPYIPADQ